MSVAGDDVKSIFGRALELPDPAARAAYLAEVCGANAALRAEVDALLAALDRAGDFLKHDPAADGGTGALASEAPATATFGTDPAEPTTDYPGRDEQAGAVIGGKYTLVEPIGEGGMGTVWRAKQTEPVKRFVAVKLIKAGMDSKQVLARFEAERQALALMDHPNIAKVLDGGLHEGRPFFVMELVKGVPITDYCDAGKLTPRERLELFVPVCQAIQHAHQKGVIHRDIKPSNVLIALYDDKPVVKVIDFGVAKATGAALTERTIDTGFGGVVGTPQYMSPEQATFNNLDIDTRSDVYALGVLLYELLTGSTPFSKNELEKKGLLEILRAVREDEPPRPSTKLSTADALPSLSANRGTEPKKLTGLLRNELDWIVMKALEKDRTRRYETANGFAADVLHYLSGEAVQAHPPSRAYRLRKFVRRNRVQVTAASLVFLALLAGIAGTTLGLVEARKQEAEAKRQEGLARDEAEAKEAARAEEEKQRTLAQAKEREANDERAKAQAAAAAEKAARLKEAEERRYAEAIADFVRADFLALTSADGQRRWNGGTLTRNATLKELLDRAADMLLKRTDLAERTRGDLAWIIGVSYRGLGDQGRAIPFLELTAKSRQKLYGEDHEETLEARNSLAVAYMLAGRLDDAIRLHEANSKTSKATLGPDNYSTLNSMGNLAQCYEYAGRLKEAVPLAEEVLERTKATHGAEHRNTLAAMNNLGSVYFAAGKRAKALTLFEDSLALMKKGLGPDNLDTLAAMNNLAGAYYAAGRLKEAVTLWEKTLELRRAKEGPDHPDTIATMGNLAEGYRASGDHEKSRLLLEETFKIAKAKLGPDDQETLRIMSNLAMAYRSGGKLDVALPMHEEALRRAKAVLGPDHPETLRFMDNLGGAYWQANKLDLAMPLFEEGFARQRKKLGDDHPDTLNMMSGLAVNFWSLRRLDKSVPLFEELLGLQVKALTREHPDTQRTVANLGVNYKDAGRMKEAIPLLEEAYKGGIAWAGEPLMEVYARGGKPTEAVKLQESLLRAARDTLPKESAPLGRLLAKCGAVRLELKQYAEAESLLRESLAIGLKAEPDEWRTFNTQSLLGGTLLGLKKYADAEPLLLKGYEGMKAREKLIPPIAGTRIPEALDRLVELYTATTNPDEVKKWRSERAKYPTPRELAPLPREKK